MGRRGGDTEGKGRVVSKDYIMPDHPTVLTSAQALMSSMPSHPRGLTRIFRRAVGPLPAAISTESSSSHGSSSSSVVGSLSGGETARLVDGTLRPLPLPSSTAGGVVLLRDLRLATGSDSLPAAGLDRSVALPLG